MEWILGLNGIGHDLTFTIIDKNGDVVFVGEEERFTRIKHSHGALPTNLSLMWALNEFGLKKEKLKYLAIGHNPALFKFPIGRLAHEQLLKYYINKWNLGDVPVLYYEHHLSHVASSYLTSSFKEAAILSVDGRGESTTCSIYKGNDDHLEECWNHKDHSIGLLYLAVTTWLGLGSIGDEGKTMGLAPYGSPTFLKLFQRKIINWKTNGYFEVDSDLINSDYSVAVLEQYLGPARKESDPITPYHQDVAATIQYITEEIMLGLCRYAYEITGIKNLCLCGGVALNSVTNGKIVESGIFKSYYIPPWSGDVGTSIGAALLAYQDKGEKKRSNYHYPSVYLGRNIPPNEVVKALKYSDLPFSTVNSPENFAAEEIAGGKVLAWCQGNAEIGARALGSRSILANPMLPDIFDKINQMIKFREPWRPFAPSVLEDDMERYFDWVCSSPYMVNVHKFKQKYKDLFPAVVHVDGTGRVQTVTEELNPLYYRLLQNMKQLTGHGVVLNTSFNIKGEPIVNTAEEAINTFLSSELDYLIIGKYVVNKKDIDPSRKIKPFNYQKQKLDMLPGISNCDVLLLIGSEYLLQYPHRDGRNSFKKAYKNLVTATKSVKVISNTDEYLIRDLFTSQQCIIPDIIPLSNLNQNRYDSVLLLADDGGYYTCMREEIELLIKLSESHTKHAYTMVSYLDIHRLEDFKEPFSIWRNSWEKISSQDTFDPSEVIEK
ncbi:carbamoyltransferase [Lederbergia ruris]|uniref:carbamoyltransferase family protein n=1 Tax=Lederbergia ruris TaxID=217495 RepID=UPI00399F7C56